MVNSVLRRTQVSQFGTCLLLALVLLAPIAGAEEPSNLVQRVLQASAADDDDALRAIAESQRTWLLACSVAEQDAAVALRLAKSSPLPDFAGLPAYLESRKERTATVVMRALAAAERGAPKGPEDRAAHIAACEAALPHADRFEASRLHGSLGQLHGWNEKGRAHFDSAVESARDVGWLRGVAELLAVAGNTAFGAGDVEGARTRWTAWVTAERRRGALGKPWDPLHNLAVIAVEVGEYAQALTTLQELAEVLEAGGPTMRADLRHILGSLAYVHGLRGEHRSAFRAVLRAAELTAKDDRLAWADSQHDLGGAYLQLGQFENALLALESALTAIGENASNEAQALKGHCLGDMGRVRYFQGDHEGALELLAEARALIEALGSGKDMVNLEAHLALANQGLKRYQAAARHAEAGLELARKDGDPWAIIDLEQNLAGTHARAGRLDEAWALNEAALGRASELGSATLLRDGYVRRAEILALRGDDAGALIACEQAYQQQSAMVLGLPEGTNATARALNAEVFERALTVAARKDDPAALFAWIERARAGALLESLGDRAQLRAALVPGKLLAEEEQARDREAKANEDLRVARADARRLRRKSERKAALQRARASRARLSEARTDLRKVRAKIQLARRSASDLLYPRNDTLEAVRGRRPKHEALVAFALVGDRALALVVRHGGARIVDMGLSAPILAASADALYAARYEEKTAGKQLERLRKLIALPLALGGDASALVVVPDGELFAVPFAAVFEKRLVTLAPSATTLGVLRDAAREGGAGQGILALGAPNYRGRRPPLPGTREEVEAIAPKETRLLGDQAGEASFAKALKQRPRWRAVHLACHGFVDTDQPLESALELTADERSDGQLTAAEVFDLEIPCELAVLSACETGRGKILESEGLLGLTRAFMVAGAPRVICSLWKVPDKPSRTLMIKFYELWKPGTSAAAALRGAQAFVRAQPKWSHPYYWAAWSLWGPSD